MAQLSKHAAREALKWYIDQGVDEVMGEEVVNRFQAVEPTSLMPKARGRTAILLAWQMRPLELWNSLGTPMNKHAIGDEPLCFTTLERFLTKIQNCLTLSWEWN